MPAPLWSRAFVLLLAQFMLVSAVVALFFPLREYLGHLGVPAEAVGFILGADALAAMVVQLLVTPFIHADNARRWLKGGVFLLALALGVESLSTNITLFTAARLLQGAGFICVVAAMMPLFVLCIPKETSGRAFGWISLARLVPYAVVPVLYEIFQIPPQALDLVLRRGILVVLLVGGMLFWLPQLPTPEGKVPVSSPPLARVRAELASPPLRRLLLANTLIYAGYANIFFFLNGFATPAGLSAGGFFSLVTLTMMGVRLLGGVLFDRFDKSRLTRLALVLAALATGLIPFAGNPWWFLALAIPCGLGWGMVMPLLNALIFDRSSPAARGLNQNLALVMLQAGYFLGPLAAGWAFERAGAMALFGLTSALFFLAIPLTGRGNAP
jgi:MFS family permease